MSWELGKGTSGLTLLFKLCFQNRRGAGGPPSHILLHSDLTSIHIPASSSFLASQHPWESYPFSDGQSGVEGAWPVQRARTRVGARGFRTSSEYLCPIFHAISVLDPVMVLSADLRENYV